MKKVVLLGSTGSIGKSALRVIEAIPDSLRITGLAAYGNYREVLSQARCFGVKHVAVFDPGKAELCEREAPGDVHVHKGAEGVEELAGIAGADIVLCAVVGMAGLKPVLAALERGITVALATKEVLVAAGHIVTEACRKSGARLLPVDSEHSAVFQCMEGREKDVARIILTASGGPFASNSKTDLDKVTVVEALKHPRWNMGRKVTVDSATLMNKGLEIMEAQWLFEMPLERVDVLIHPESIVHSIVEFSDGVMMAQMTPPDMRFAIQYALTWPERKQTGLPRLDLAGTGCLHFSVPDETRFPCLRLARESARAGGTMPAVLNAANEVAVQKFLDGKMVFSGIWKTVQRVMEAHSTVASPDLDGIMEADAWARRMAGQ